MSVKIGRNLGFLIKGEPENGRNVDNELKRNRQIRGYLTNRKK